MGGRGSFASGNNVPFRYETVGKISGVKVLKGINGKLGLPEESHASKSYILVHPDGAFKQYREFNPDHTANFDIDFHPEYKISGHYKPIYHIHFYLNGVRDKVGRRLTFEEYNKYKKYFGGKKQ